jgi:hypothetical protein
VELAVAFRLDPREILGMDPELVATMVSVLEDVNGAG